MNLAALVSHAAVGQRPETPLVARHDDAVFCQQRQGKRAFEAQQRFAQCMTQVRLPRPRHQVGDHFGVAGRLKDRSRDLELVTQAVAVGQVAVVRDRQGALVALDVEGLRILTSSVARGRIAGVADRHVPGKLFELRFAENLVDQAGRLVREDVHAVAGTDAGALLAAVLQRIETQIGEVRGLGVAEDGKDAAFVVEAVAAAVEAVLQAHDASNMRSSAVSHAAYNSATGARNASDPLISTTSSSAIVSPTTGASMP